MYDKDFKNEHKSLIYSQMSMFFQANRLLLQCVFIRRLSTKFVGSYPSHSKEQFDLIQELRAGCLDSSMPRY